MGMTYGIRHKNIYRQSYCRYEMNKYEIERYDEIQKDKRVLGFGHEVRLDREGPIYGSWPLNPSTPGNDIQKYCLKIYSEYYTHNLC